MPIEQNTNPSKNILAKSGYDITDMDYIEEFGVDPTKEPMKMFDIVEEENYKAYLASGDFTEKQAKDRAASKKREAIAMAKNQGRL